MNHSPGPWKWSKIADGREHLFQPMQAGEETNSIGVTRETGLTDADAALIALAPDMREMLLELEWTTHTRVGLEYNETTPEFCPCCGEERDRGHRRASPYESACRLATLLKKLR